MSDSVDSVDKMAVDVKKLNENDIPPQAEPHLVTESPIAKYQTPEWAKPIPVAPVPMVAPIRKIEPSPSHPGLNN